MPNTIPQNKFATHCNVTRQGIASAVKAGLIAVYKKKINIDHRKTCEYYYSKTGKVLKPDVLLKKVKRAAPVKKKKIEARKPTPPKEIPPAAPLPVEPITAPIPPDHDPEPDDGYKLPKGIKSFEDITIHNIHLIPIDLVKKWKELEATKKSRQDREHKRGKLIDKVVVEKVFAKIHTVDSNQWKTLENKIAPDLCSLFKAQDGGEQSIAARKLINSEVTKILEYTKRIIDDFLKNNKELAQ